ncbi:MAG: restriction endonuclease subunit S [Planctomycetes bacterium]|nr:restriction endonuclease subunit S [Planctomycetota bacterium]
MARRRCCGVAARRQRGNHRCRGAIRGRSVSSQCADGAGGIGQITLLTNSSSQGNIGMGDIEKLVLQLPPLPEQSAVATVLADMDAELVALEVRRNKTRDLKQAMMQELLTGKTRLVTAEVAHA